MLTGNHWTECRVPDGGVGEGPKELKGFAAPWRGSKSVNWPDPLPPGAPGDWSTNKIVHMEGSMVLALYVAEDGLVGHQCEDRPLGLWEFDAPVNAMEGRWSWVVGEHPHRGRERGGWDRRFLEGKPGKWITFEM